MKCPVCGNELRRIEKKPEFGYCSNCKKAFKWQENQTGYTMSKSQNTKLCKYCKSPIPANAKICPNCRKKQKGGALKVVLIIFFIFIITGVIGLFAFDNEDSNNTSSTKSDSKKGSSGKNDSFNIGETAEYNGVEITILNYEESSGNEWSQPENGNVFMFPEIEIVNNSDEEISISSMLSFECYVDDYKTDFSTNAFMAMSTENGKQQLDGSIAPGKKLIGVLGIEAPNDWKNIEIYYKDNVWLDSNFSFIISK